MGFVDGTSVGASVGESVGFPLVIPLGHVFLEVGLKLGPTCGSFGSPHALSVRLCSDLKKLARSCTVMSWGIISLSHTLWPSGYAALTALM